MDTFLVNVIHCVGWRHGQWLKWKIWDEGTPFSAWAPSNEGRAHQMLMLVNIRCRICLSFSQSVGLHVFYHHQLVCTDVVTWSYTTVPVAFSLPFLCIFTNLEVRTWRCIISLQSYFYYWYSITHSLFHSRLKSFLFGESSLPQLFLSLLQDSLYGFPRLFTATSEHIRLFYFLVFFSVFTLF